MAHPGGRPTKLTPALVKKAKAFVAVRRADRMLLPTIEGLALELNISRDTVHAWSDVKEGDEGWTQLHGQFSDVINDLRNAQAEKLVQYGLSGKYVGPIVRLMLSSKHGYVEKQEQDITHSGAVQFVNDIPRPKDDGDSQST